MTPTMRKKMFKAEASAKAHLKQSTSRSRTAASGFAARKDSVVQDSGLSPSGERNPLGLKQISKVEAQGKSRIRPGNCFQCGKPGHWKAQCSTFQSKPSTSF